MFLVPNYLAVRPGIGRKLFSIFRPCGENFNYNEFNHEIRTVYFKHEIIFQQLKLDKNAFTKFGIF